MAGKLQAMTRAIDAQKLMGKWFVLKFIPNFIEKEGKTFNETEVYEFDPVQQHITVTLSYQRTPDGPVQRMYQRA